MKITVRRGTESDFGAILLLIEEFAFFQKTPGKVHVTLEQMHEDKELFKCFVAENETKQLVGFASYFFAYYSWSGKAVYLDDLYVSEDYRKHGIGTKLLTTIIDEAKKTGCKKVRWQVSNWNETAINFYKKMGAVIDEVEINCDLVLA